MSASVLLAKFPTGRIVATANAVASIRGDEVLTGLSRHICGDWGSLDAEDWSANEQALTHGGRLLSRCLTNTGLVFWIITESDRSATTVLLPEDY